MWPLDWHSGWSTDYKPEQSSEVLWDADWDDEDAPQEFKDKLTAELKKHSKAST